MTWIESHSNLARHPKTRRLMKLLGWSLPDTIGNLHLLWWWALDFAPTGDLTQFSAEDLTADLDLRGTTPEQFIAAMVQAGFLDRIEHTLCIHDWTDYRPKPRRSSAGSSRPANAEQSQNLAVPPRREPEQPAPPRASRDDQMVGMDFQAVRRHSTSASAEREPQACAPTLEHRESIPFNNEADHSEPSSNPSPVHAPPGQESHSANAEQNSSPVVPPKQETQIPHVLDEQPGFTDIWWPKLLEESRERGCTLNSIKQGNILERLAREPLAAIPTLKKSIASYSHTDSDASAVLIANST